jgi:hypothetical protein
VVTQAGGTSINFQKIYKNNYAGVAAMPSSLLSSFRQRKKERSIQVPLRSTREQLLNIP